jgi:lipopolysaccharide transport system ATP-binding protein
LHRLIGHASSALGVHKENNPIPYFREFWALRDVSFQIRHGETLGIIGLNGSGKSTLLQIIAGTLTPTSGNVFISGRIAALLELGSGFNPEFSGRDNIFLNGYILGLQQKEILERYDQIVAFADIGDFIEQPVKTYSSGMFVRLAFAVQAHVDASIVIIDEALAVGDIFFRQKCYKRLKKLKESGAAIILVSHSMSDIEEHCDRSILLEHGNVRFIGKSCEATKHYYLLNQPMDLVPGTINQRLSQLTVNDLNNFTCGSDIWLKNSIFTDASGLAQVSSGMAKCVRYAMCDIYDTPCRLFYQDDVVIFYYEFILLKSIAVPYGGIVLRNDKGILVHGKGSLEYGIDVPEYFTEGTIIRCKQSIELKLQPGEYTVELGLSSVDPVNYKNRSSLSHEQLFSQIIRFCHLPELDYFCVGLRTGKRDGAQLTHHGIANLPGEFEFSFRLLD